MKCPYLNEGVWWIVIALMFWQCQADRVIGRTRRGQTVERLVVIFSQLSQLGLIGVAMLEIFKVGHAGVPDELIGAAVAQYLLYQFVRSLAFRGARRNVA